MLTIRKALRCLLVWGMISLTGIVSAATPQTGKDAGLPIGQKKGANGPNGAHGLTLAGSGKLVYDSNKNQNVYWLADANLAGDPQMRKMLGATGLKINADGTMDYPTALRWVVLLNNFNGGKGYLGHTDWQLPDTPARDRTCSSLNVDNFGATCTGSALGNLYTVGLGKTFPDSVVPDFSATIGPFENVQPSMYWTLDTNSGGQVTSSFLSHAQAANTPKYNYMHVLATIQGHIGKQAPAGSGVVAYTTGEAKGKAVYDATVPGGRTCVLDANLARSNHFAIKGTTTITSKVNGQTLTVPLIDKDGAMLFETANNPKTGWIAAMKRSNYAGTSAWALPSFDELKTLFTDLKLQAGDSRLVFQGRVDLFQHLQPFFYWACQRVQKGTSRSPCDPKLNPPPTRTKKGTVPMAWSFNFDNGFEGTSETTKEFYVMVYYPAPLLPHPPVHTPPCTLGTKCK